MVSMTVVGSMQLLTEIQRELEGCSYVCLCRMDGVFHMLSEVKLHVTHEVISLPLRFIESLERLWSAIQLSSILATSTCPRMSCF